MAAIPLRDVGRAIFVTRPRRGGVYLKRFSYPKGYVPPHLKPFMEKFTTAAKGCTGVMAGLTGNEKVIAFNMCIGEKLKK